MEIEQVRNSYLCDEQCNIIEKSVQANPKYCQNIIEYLYCLMNERRIPQNMKIFIGNEEDYLNIIFYKEPFILKNYRDVRFGKFFDNDEEWEKWKNDCYETNRKMIIKNIEKLEKESEGQLDSQEEKLLEEIKRKYIKEYNEDSMPCLMTVGIEYRFDIKEHKDNKILLLIEDGFNPYDTYKNAKTADMNNITGYLMDSSDIITYLVDGIIINIKNFDCVKTDKNTIDITIIENSINEIIDYINND